MYAMYVYDTIEAQVTTIRETFIILYKKKVLRGSFFSISHK